MDAQLLVLFPLIRCFSSSVVYVWQCSISACSLEVVCSLDQIHKSLFSWNSHFQSSYYWLNSDETTVFFKICIFFLQSDVFKFPFSFWEGWLGLSKELFSLSSSFDHMHCLYYAISITRMSFFMALLRLVWQFQGLMLMNRCLKFVCFSQWWQDWYPTLISSITRNRSWNTYKTTLFFAVKKAFLFTNSPAPSPCSAAGTDRFQSVSDTLLS